jgi:hypothetical protein
MTKPAKTLLLLSILLLARVTFSQTITHVEFQAHDSLICNPERGFMHFSSAPSNGSYNNLELAELLSYRDEGITLMFRYFHLDEFTASDISGDYLIGMKKDFEILRQAGMKLVMRFSYCESMNKPYGDAPIDIVLRHIEQVKPILQENSDVILVVQAGFIGAWGEWYYTDHYSYSPGVIFPEHWALRRQIVNALLDAVPADRMIEVRTPGYKMSLLENENPVSEEQAYSNLPIARIAHHNDCFVSSADDYGTYDDTLVEKPYLEADTKYTMIGGETCNPSPPYSDCPNSLLELRRFHWTYLNIDYNVQLLNEWRAQGCFPEVENKLGYRYRMVEADIQDSAKPGGEFQAVIKMINEGWSNPVNPRDIELVAIHKTSGKKFFYPMQEDIRFYPLNEVFTLTIKAGIPQGMEDGEFDLFLNLPDPELSLRNEPKFAIRTANSGTWDAVAGTNSLLAGFIVTDNPGLPDYSGTGFFYPGNNTIVETAEIIVDGQVDDWFQLMPVCEDTGQAAQSLKVYNTADSMFFLVQGENMQAFTEFFIDADNNINSGYYSTHWKPNGSDYMVQNEKLYSYSGTAGEWSWEEISTVNYYGSQTVFEIGFALTDLNEVPLDIRFGIAFGEDPENIGGGSFLPAEGSYFIQVQKLLDGPEAIRCKGNGTKVVAYWTANENDTVYSVLEKSINSDDYQQVTILKNSVIAFTDENLQENTAYLYRVYQTDGRSVSPATAPFEITTTYSLPDFIEIETDGDPTDWNIIPPIATNFTLQLNALRLVNFGDSLFYSFEGPQEIVQYAVYLNTDRDEQTGLPDPDDNTSGYDYLIRSDSLYKAGTTAWQFVTKVFSRSSAGFLEGGCRMEEVNMIESSSALVSGKVNEGIFSRSEFIKLPQPGVPLYFNVKNSETYPQTRIVVEWSRPGNCQGFIIERSVGDSVHFVPLVDLPYSDMYYHDNTVHPDTLYLYRMYSYSSLNRSAYTAIYGGYPGQISGLEESSFNDATIRMYPNPSHGQAKIEVWMRFPSKISVDIFKITGEKVAGYKSEDNMNYQYFDIEEAQLDRGVYIGRVTGGNINASVKIVIY